MQKPQLASLIQQHWPVLQWALDDGSELWLSYQIPATYRDALLGLPPCVLHLSSSSDSNR